MSGASRWLEENAKAAVEPAARAAAAVRTRARRFMAVDSMGTLRLLTERRVRADVGIRARRRHTPRALRIDSRNDSHGDPRPSRRLASLDPRVRRRVREPAQSALRDA